MNGPEVKVPEPARKIAIPVRMGGDDRHCNCCLRPLKVRRSTPSKHMDDGRLLRWCKKCWHKKVLPRAVTA